MVTTFYQVDSLTICRLAHKKANSVTPREIEGLSLNGDKWKLNSNSKDHLRQFRSPKALDFIDSIRFHYLQFPSRLQARNLDCSCQLRHYLCFIGQQNIILCSLCGYLQCITQNRRHVFKDTINFQSHYC